MCYGQFLDIFVCNILTCFGTLHTESQRHGNKRMDDQSLIKSTKTATHAAKETLRPPHLHFGRFWKWMQILYPSFSKIRRLPLNNLRLGRVISSHKKQRRWDWIESKLFFGCHFNHPLKTTFIHTVETGCIKSEGTDKMCSLKPNSIQPNYLTQNANTLS